MALDYVSLGLNAPLIAHIEATPQLKAIENPLFLKFMARATYLGDSWDSAVREFQNMLQDTKVIAGEFMEQTKKQRESTENEFRTNVNDLILAAANETQKTLSPKGGIVINVEFDREFKNADGSPMMDEKNNPIRGTFVSYEYRWGDKKASTPRVAGTPNAPGAGRKPGDFIFPDEPEAFRNMSDYALKNHKAEYESKGTKTTRQLLESLGYDIPDDAVKGEDGELHFIVTRKTPAAV
jgi:hypothetical protein